jgi:hypothetical protein
LSPEKGRDLIEQGRKQLLELARPMLESLVHEVVGVAEHFEYQSSLIYSARQSLRQIL